MASRLGVARYGGSGADRAHLASPPIAGASAADVAAYYTAHHIGLEIESVANGVGATLLVIFAATFHARVRSMQSLTAFVAAAILAACMLVEVAAFHPLAFRPNPEPRAPRSSTTSRASRSR